MEISVNGKIMNPLIGTEIKIEKCLKTEMNGNVKSYENETDAEKLKSK